MKTLKKVLILLLIIPLTYYFVSLEAVNNNLEVFYFNDSLQLENIDLDLYDLEDNFLFSFDKDESLYNEVVWYRFYVDEKLFEDEKYLLYINLPEEENSFNVKLTISNDALNNNTYTYYLKEKTLTKNREDLQTNITYASFINRKEIKFYSNFEIINDNIKLLKDSVYYEEYTVKTFSPQNQHVITLDDDLDFTKEYYLELTTNDGFPSSQVIIKHDEIYKEGFFKTLFDYNGNDLGANYSANSTTFKVWAPTLDEITLNLYSDGSIKESLKMLPEEKFGVFSYTKNGNLKNYEYTFSFTRNRKRHEILDPYSTYVSENNRSLIVDLNNTNPTGFKTFQPKHKFTSKSDYIIYESSINQLTTKLPNTTLQNTYLGLAEKDLNLYYKNTKYSTGLDHLKELNITHLALSDLINTNNSLSVINSNYTKNESIGVEISELKQTIKTLNDNGINVILDINLYNNPISSLEKLMPGYYYESDNDAYELKSSKKTFFETEHYMTNKYLESQLRYLVEEFKFTGLKINPLNSLNINHLNTLLRELESIDENFLIYGEFSEDTPLINENKLNSRSLDKTRDIGFVDNNRFSLEPDYLSSNSNNGLKGYILSSWNQTYNTLSPYQSYKNLVNHTSISNNLNKQLKTIQFLSYGVQIIKGGEEMGLNNADYLSYEYKYRNKNIFKMYKDLIDFRKQHPSLKFSSHSDLKNNVIYDVDEGLVYYRIINKYDLYPDILILHNFAENKTFNLPVGLPNNPNYNRDGEFNWQIVFDNLNYYPLQTKLSGESEVELQENQSLILHFGLNKDNIVEDPIKTPETPKTVNILYYMLAFGSIIIAGGIITTYFILKSTTNKKEEL